MFGQGIEVPLETWASEQLARNFLSTGPWSKSLCGASGSDAFSLWEWVLDHLLHLPGCLGSMVSDGVRCVGCTWKDSGDFIPNIFECLSPGEAGTDSESHRVSLSLLSFVTHSEC